MDNRAHWDAMVFEIVEEKEIEPGSLHGMIRVLGGTEADSRDAMWRLLESGKIFLRGDRKLSVVRTPPCKECGR